MTIDRIAQAMTGGRPRAGFTARVMAPIEGRPQPGFTARVMQGLDAPAVGRGFSPGAQRAALLLVSAAVALAAGVTVMRAWRVTFPVAPAAPRLAVAQAGIAQVFGSAHLPAPPPVRAAQAVRPAEQTFTSAEPSAPAAPAAPAGEPPPIYMIAALEGPGDIAMRSIDPAACTIPALDAPAPLTVPDLPGSAGGSQNAKEKS